jgi:hypothetical protein
MTGPETPAEHVRNAMQLLMTESEHRRNADSYLVILTRDNVDACLSRLRTALEGMER